MEKLHCAYCKSELIQGDDQQFETLSEHVCNPNREDYPLRRTWVCDNKERATYKKDMFWDDYGDHYGYSRDVEFPEHISAAFPSIARELETTIYKKGLTSKKYLSPAFLLWFLQPVIEYVYTADDYGKVLTKKRKLRWLRKDKLFRKDDWGYHIYYTFPLVHIYNSIFRDLYWLRAGYSDAYKANQIKELFDPLPNWDKRWWRHFTRFLYKIMFYKHYKKYKNDKRDI